jgi:hypothetical protein
LGTPGTKSGDAAMWTVYKKPIVPIILILITLLTSCTQKKFTYGDSTWTLTTVDIGSYSSQSNRFISQSWQTMSHVIKLTFTCDTNCSKGEQLPEQVITIKDDKGKIYQPWVISVNSGEGFVSNDFYFLLPSVTYSEYRSNKPNYQLLFQDGEPVDINVPSFK